MSRLNDRIAAKQARGRKLKVHYIEISPGNEHAMIESHDGFYICTVEQTSEESKRTFRSRTRHLQQCLSHSNRPLIHAGGETV